MGASKKYSNQRADTRTTCLISSSVTWMIGQNAPSGDLGMAVRQGEWLTRSVAELQGPRETLDLGQQKLHEVQSCAPGAG